MGGTVVRIRTPGQQVPAWFNPSWGKTCWDFDLWEKCVNLMTTSVNSDMCFPHGAYSVNYERILSIGGDVKLPVLCTGESYLTVMFHKG